MEKYTFKNNRAVFQIKDHHNNNTVSYIAQQPIHKLKGLEIFQSKSEAKSHITTITMPIETSLVHILELEALRFEHKDDYKDEFSV